MTQGFKLACLRASLLISALALGGPQLSAHVTIPPSGPFTIATVQVDSQKSEFMQLLNDGYDIAGIDMEAGTVDVIVRDSAAALSIRFQGYKVVSTREIDARLAPDSNYKTPAEVQEFVQRMAREHPDLIHLESFGKTVEGRDMWAVKISDNPEQREVEEPAILFNSMHHAREIMTTEVALDTIEYLVGNYGINPQVTHWVDNNEIWVIAQVNPDGNNRVWNGNSMWRKNARGGYGVDINRNYSYAWNTCGGSSGSTWADDYRGPSAGSEPETQAMMNFVSRVQPVFDISYHSYSELVLYPYGCDNQRTPDKDVLESIGRDMARRLPRESGNGYYAPGTPWETLYSVDGGDIDWMYHEHDVFPFVIEMNSSSQGFQPAYRYRQPTVEKMRGAWQMLLNKLDASGVRGVISDQDGRKLTQATVTVENQAPGMTQTRVWRVKNDGSYHVILNPGSYRLTFQTNGRRVSKDVIVQAQRVNMDVQL